MPYYFSPKAKCDRFAFAASPHLLVLVLPPSKLPETRPKTSVPHQRRTPFHKMVDELCPCVRCFDLPDEQHLLPRRNVLRHLREYGRPTEKQMAALKRRQEARDSRERRRVARDQARGAREAGRRGGSEGAEDMPGTTPSNPDNVESMGGHLGGEDAMEQDPPGLENGGGGDAMMQDVGDQPEPAGSASGQGSNSGQEAEPDGPWIEIPVPRGVTMEEEEEEDWNYPDPEDEPLSFSPPAYEQDEPPAVRMAYLQAVINDTKHHIPVRKVESNLRTTLKIIDAAGGLPVAPIPAQTLETARRRLGIDDEQWIIQYGACPVCWKLYHPETLKGLENPACVSANCTGVLYTEVQDSKGKVSRRTSLVIPQVSLIDSVRRMVRRKGYRAKLRDNRNKPAPAGQSDDPSLVMKDIYDGQMWNDLRTNIKREKEDRPGGSVRDIGNDGGEGGNLNDNRIGLHATINLDWFGCVKNRPHSTGPIYLSFNDLPREERFLQYNVVCLAITPGPCEPTTEQLNNVMEPIMYDVALLKNGVTMKMYNNDETALVDEKVYLDVICNNCDTPGARKIAGFAGHSALVHPCPWCRCTLLDVNKPAGYNFDNFTLRDDPTVLKQKFLARESSAARKASILERHGVQWSALDYLPGWRPTAQTALDFMHCIYLGIVKFLFMTILFAAHLFPGAGGENSSKKKFERVVNSIVWPSHITRLPKNLGDNQSLKKADEWRRILTVAPVILWVSWKDDADQIPDTEPPVLPAEVITTEHSRKRKSLYDAILYLCAGVRLMSNKTITMAQAITGQMYLKMYCLRMMALGVTLTVNHHLAMHFAHMIRLFGPVYAWWLFAFERFNGMLEKVNHNGHDGGRIELTLLRNWVRSHLLYELLLALPDTAHAHEVALIDQIIENETRRGGMAVEIAIFRAEASVNNVSLPKHLKRAPLNLYQYPLLNGGDGDEAPTELYELLLQYVQTTWPEHQFHRQFDDGPENALPLIGDRVARRLSYVRKDGIRYAPRSNKRGKSGTDSYAFIQQAGNARVPIVIEDAFLLKVADPDGAVQLPAHVCLLVRRLQSSAAIDGFHFPWHGYATTLGIHVAEADRLGPFELIPASHLNAPLALIPAQLTSENINLHIAISFDHLTVEPESPFEDEEGDGRE